MQPQVKFCTKCGNPSVQGSMICPKCGAPAPGTVFLTPPATPQTAPVKKKRGARFWLGIACILGGSFTTCIAFVLIVLYLTGNGF